MFHDIYCAAVVQRAAFVVIQQAVVADCQRAAVLYRATFDIVQLTLLPFFGRLHRQQTVTHQRAKILIDFLVIIAISYSIYSACWIWIWNDLISD